MKVSVEEARYIAARIPDAKLVVFPGDDHLPWTPEMDDVLDELRASDEEAGR